MIKLEEFLKAIQSSADAVVQSIMDKNIQLLSHYFIEVDPEDDEEELSKKKKTRKGEKDIMSGSSLLQPKMVAVKFPRQTKDGPEEHIVYVPLISLAPVSQLQLDSLEFDMEIDIYEDEDDVQISFPLKSKSGFLKKPMAKGKNTNASIKLTVSGFDQPEGLSIMLEGYHKAIRGQMPD